MPSVQNMAITLVISQLYLNFTKHYPLYPKHIIQILLRHPLLNLTSLTFDIFHCQSLCEWGTLHNTKTFILFPTVPRTLYTISHLCPHHLRTPTLTHWQFPLSATRILCILAFFNGTKISWRNSVPSISHGMCSIIEYFFFHRRPFTLLSMPPCAQLKPRILFPQGI